MLVGEFDGAAGPSVWGHNTGCVFEYPVAFFVVEYLTAINSGDDDACFAASAGVEGDGRVNGDDFGVDVVFGGGVYPDGR